MGRPAPTSKKPFSRRCRHAGGNSSALCFHPTNGVKLVVPRSWRLASQSMISVGSGVIDPDYPGEIVAPTDRVPQLILERIVVLNPEARVNDDRRTDRGASGFGPSVYCRNLSEVARISLMRRSSCRSQDLLKIISLTWVCPTSALVLLDACAIEAVQKDCSMLKRSQSQTQRTCRIRRMSCQR